MGMANPRSLCIERPQEEQPKSKHKPKSTRSMSGRKPTKIHLINAPAFRPA